MAKVKLKTVFHRNLWLLKFQVKLFFIEHILLDFFVLMQSNHLHLFDISKKIDYASDHYLAGPLRVIDIVSSCRCSSIDGYSAAHLTVDTTTP